METIKRDELRMPRTPEEKKEVEKKIASLNNALFAQIQLLFRTEWCEPELYNQLIDHILTKLHNKLERSDMKNLYQEIAAKGKLAGYDR